MITIGTLPQKIKRFFKPVKTQVSEHVFGYFWSMVLAMCLGHVSTIDRLVRLLRNSPPTVPITANSSGEATGTNRR
jgi:hypothetical protein